MSEPSQFHELPSPHSSVAGINTVDKGNLKPSKIAKKWKPNGAPASEPDVSTVSRFSGRLIDRETGKAYSADEFLALLAPAVYDGEPDNAEAATGVLTGTTIAADDTVTIGDLTYTFVAELTEDTGDAVPFEVLVGASDSDSLDNLIAAINGDAGEGTLYGTGTTAQPLLSAAAGAGDTIDLTAVTAGAAGNDIPTTDGLTAGGFGAATLTGGVDGTPGKLGQLATDGTDVWTALTEDLTTTQAGWVKTFTA